MQTLLSYSPGDLLLFSPRAYWALVAGNNIAWWPLALLAPLAGLVVIVLLARRPRNGQRGVLAFTGVAWWFVTWSFLWQQYRAINWAVDWVLLPFLAQGALLLLLSGRPGRGEQRPHRWRLGLILVAWGALVHPLGFLLDDRSVAAADTWLLFPDPLAVTTLGVALATLDGWRLALALPVPLLWSLVGGATLLGLGAPAGWGLLAAAGLSVLACLPLSPVTHNQRGTC